MRTAILVRLQTGDAGTFGRLITENGAFYSTGELPWRDNERKLSSIPPGVYRCTWRLSPRFRGCYHVAGVPGRSDILIHAGNFCGDVTKHFVSDVEGCILLGKSVTEIARPDGKLQLGVNDSKVSLLAFENEYRREPFDLSVAERFS